MPCGVLDKPCYGFKPPLLLRSGHVQTLLAGFRKAEQHASIISERISTPDGDFLDLNWSHCTPSAKKNLAILCHGLEGNYSRSYMTGMSNALNANGWDSLGWNLRGCSEEINKSAKLYHAGCTDDLNTVCEHAVSTQGYSKIILIGFSLGANLTLLYASENRKSLKDILSKVISISAPIDMTSSARALARFFHRGYEKRFLSSMKEKIKLKARQFPLEYDIDLLDRVDTIEEFDRTFVAPFHGFSDEKDYWQKCSSLPKLGKISVPTLIVNAKDDPFLGPECYPSGVNEENGLITFEAPVNGGHVGFFDSYNTRQTWAEKRSIAFITESKALSQD